MFKSITVIATILVVTVVILVACKKGNQTAIGVDLQQEATTLSHEAAIDLAKKMYQDGTLEEFEKIANTYRDLSAEDMKTFLLARKEVEIAMADARAKTTADKKLAKEQAAAAADFRIAVNEKALLQHHHAINKLSGNFLETLSKQVYYQPEFNILREIRPRKEGGEVVAQACIQWNYWTNATYAGQVAGQWNYTWSSATQTGDTDCDWEFAFDGQYNYTTARNAATHILMSWPTWAGGFGGVVAKRVYWHNDGPDTYVLLGANSVTLHTGGPGNVALNMKN